MKEKNRTILAKLKGEKKCFECGKYEGKFGIQLTGRCNSCSRKRRKRLAKVYRHILKHL